MSLDRLNTETVKLFLKEREAQISKADGFLYCSCFRLKPEQEFLKSQIRKKRSKLGSEANQRACFDCMKQKRRICPGSIVNMADGGNKRVYCLVCLTVRYHFCNKCRWCVGCAKGGVAKTYRKSGESESSSHDGMIDIVNECSDHDWYKAPPANKSYRSDRWDDIDYLDPDSDRQRSP